MSYKTLISCDRDGCNTTIEVPQSGAIPKGWLVLGWPKANVALSNQPKGQPPQPQVQMQQSVFCSWKCVLHFVKQFIVEK